MPQHYYTKKQLILVQRVFNESKTIFNISVAPQKTDATSVWAAIQRYTVLEWGGQMRTNPDSEGSYSWGAAEFLAADMGSIEKDGHGRYMAWDNEDRNGEIDEELSSFG